MMSEFREIEVGDAYVKATHDGRGWIIGTAQVEQTFSAADGGFQLRHWRSKLTAPATDYLSGEAATPFFELDAAPFLEQFTFETLGCLRYERAKTILIWEQLSLAVAAGDLLAFRADRCDETPSSLRWNIALEYVDGPGPNSEPALTTEALYTLDVAGSLEKIPGAEGEIPGTAEFNFGHRRNLMRLWRAPRAGTIQVGGSLVSGSHGDLDVSLRRLRPVEMPPDSGSGMTWTPEEATACESVTGGRPAARLDLTLKNGSLRVRLHCLAYPGTGIIRHWLELENNGADACTLPSPAPLFLRLRPDRTWIHSRMTGGNSGPTQGVLRRFDVTPEYRQSFGGEQTCRYLPWTALETPDGDGLFAVSESLSAWNIAVRREADSPLLLAINLLSYSGWQLPPGGKVELPPITTGVFRDGLDGMGMQLYDWQYQYLWDYTNPDYYAKMTYAVPWVFCCGNLQEQFAYRLAGLDLNGADCAAAGGFDMLWDDAGWAKYPGFPVPDSYGSVFHHEYEGPDYAMTRRYLEKSGLKWLIWFCGRPSAGVMNAKTAAWGPFQWRTDSVGLFTPESETAFRRGVREFLDRNPQSSFHTCSGGSPYAHALGIQRLADLNYLSDFGRGDEVNYYFSYLDTPDKWVDILEPIANQLHYHHATSRHMLALVPNWAFADDPAEIELLRRNVTELYRYLRREGIAGRWSYVFHPRVEGDREYYYFQRSNHDRTKALIILKHQMDRPVTVYPRGLLSNHRYTVGFDSSDSTVVRGGGELMTEGIRLHRIEPGELIYLGLPNRPGTGTDRTPPAAVGNAYRRFEFNLGHSGVGLFWTGTENPDRVSFYEIRRNGRSLGRTSVGFYYFDHAAGWDPEADYTVRAVGVNGISGPWRHTEKIAGMPLTCHALGGHFARRNRDGWSTEFSTDGRKFLPMKFIAPAKNPAADVDGGTPNQRGGIEGWWEYGSARIGRGFQCAAPDGYCVRSWTAPRTGTVRLLGRVMKEYFRRELGSERLSVAIRRDDELLWQAELTRNTPDGIIHDLRLTLQAGETLRFLLGPGSDPDHDVIVWMPKIVYDPSAKEMHGDSVVRISCGTEADYVDGTGNVWTCDRAFDGGQTVKSAGPLTGLLPTAADDELYRTGREGEDFSYRIPVRPGLYSIRLKFAETDTAYYFERPMTVEINGHPVLQDFDILQTMRGAGNVCDRTFHYQMPDCDGCIRLRFRGRTTPLKSNVKALVRAIEILPEPRPEFRVNCGSAYPFIDWNTDEWLADGDVPGTTLSKSATVKLATPTIWDQALYRTARLGREIVYSVPLPPGHYCVQMKFAELQLSASGERPMDIFINGLPVKTGWDPAAAAGETGMATGIRVEEIAPDGNGFLTVKLVAVGANDAMLQALEIR